MNSNTILIRTNTQMTTLFHERGQSSGRELSVMLDQLFETLPVSLSQQTPLPVLHASSKHVFKNYTLG